MAKLLKLRRGTTSQHSSFTGAEGEVTVDTTKDTIVVHDGSTAGGIPLAKESTVNAINTTLINDTTPQLGGNLDVNAQNILLGDSSDGATDDVIKFGAGTDLSIYSNGTEGIFGIPDGGTLKIKDGTNTMATFSGASNQLDIGGHTVFIGASSNASWDKANNRFSGTITEVNVTANNSTDETVYPLFVDGATGSQGAETDTGLTYNPSTGLLTTAAVTTTGNVTVGGNLQVDGTTTTVNSSTMTVTDKNIEIAKGAANNAAADGAGITVDAGSDTDKTWNWVNSTAAWTSSENIVLTGSKKLYLGTNQDSDIYDNGSFLLLRGNGAVKIMADTTHSSLIGNTGGATELYHDNNKKIETTATGVDVTGTAVTDGLTVAGDSSFTGQSDFTGQLKEAVTVTAGKLSDNLNLDIENGNVFLFTTAESTTSTPNIRYNGSTTLDSKMAVGDCLAVTVITTANASGFSAQLTIDGAAVTENWTGGSAPSAGGSSGVDIHAYTIIKTASNTYTVIANHTKTS